MSIEADIWYNVKMIITPVTEGEPSVKFDPDDIERQVMEEFHRQTKGDRIVATESTNEFKLDLPRRGKSRKKNNQTNDRQLAALYQVLEKLATLVSEKLAETKVERESLIAHIKSVEARCKALEQFVVNTKDDTSLVDSVIEDLEQENQNG